MVESCHQTSRVSSLLGLTQIRELRLRWESRALVEDLVSHGMVLSAILLSISPGLFILFVSETGWSQLLAMTSVALLGVLLGRRLIGVDQRDELLVSLRNLHTAFALGVTPLLLLMLLDPDILVNLALQKVVSTPQEGPRIALWHAGLVALAIAGFTGTTEELIYRGLLVRVLRRWDWLGIICSPASRDIAAVVFSSALFAVAHLPFWGLYMSIAVFGLGLGLGMGYLANNENLKANIIYHCSFNFLSLMLSIVV